MTTGNLAVRRITITDHARQSLIRHAESRPASVSYDDAVAILVNDHGYGIVSARGLLLLTDQNGTYCDGSTVITGTWHGYRIESR